MNLGFWFVCLQLRLIAGEAPTSFVPPHTFFLRCSRCQRHRKLCPRLCHGAASWIDGARRWCSAVGWQLHGACGLLSRGFDSSDCPCGSLDTSSALRQDEWAQAAERYGLFRPSLDKTAIVVHRQTTQRWAVTPEGWDEIPVHPNMRPEEILADIAYWHTDLRGYWEQVEWWLYRVHAFSRSSSQLVLAGSYQLCLDPGR